VVFLEQKTLFASKGQVPVGDHVVPFGQAAVTKPGKDLTIVSCGLLVHRCMDAAKQLENQGISCEVIDLRTIVPLDVDTIIASVAKTGRLLVVDEAFPMCGIGAEIAAAVMEQAFDELDAPVGRLHTDPVTFPFSPSLEDEIVVNVNKIMNAAKAVLAGQPVVPIRARGGAGASVATFSASTEKTATPAEVKETPAASAEGVCIIMPNQDLTITEATIVRWLKKVGEAVTTGQPVAEVETEKAVSEIEAPADGIITEILAPEGTVVKLGQQIGMIRPN
jgi:2-oxoisovalerate dehydrogenase E1 component